MSQQNDDARYGLSRRGFLGYVGAGASLFMLADCTATGDGGKEDAVTAANWVQPDGRGNWKAPSYPVPLPGDTRPVSGDAQNHASFRVVDDLVLPEGFRYHMVAAWGDEIPSDAMPGGSFHFGFNCDYTGLIQHPAGPEHFWLFVNHEDLSFRVWQQGHQTAKGKTLPQITLKDRDLLLDGEPIDTRKPTPAQAEKLDIIASEGLDDLGVSIIHVRRDESGVFHVAREARDHKRISTISHRTPGPGRPAIRMTGPAGSLLSGNLPGTFANCSGGTTPWGTFLTCEENIQNHTYEFVDANGKTHSRTKGYPRPYIKGRGNEPMHFHGLGYALTDPLDGRHFGWVCEVDPNSGLMVKHSGMGRFRHENVAVRCEKGKRLAAYMGDDRRGGHVWKFVSNALVEDPESKANSKLFEDGILYAAGFTEDFKGRWIPLTPETPLVEPEPQHMSGGCLPLPGRPDGSYALVVAGETGKFQVKIDKWKQSIEAFAGKPFDQCTLGDLVSKDVKPEDRQAIILIDAYLMANAVGGTPTSRPEDLEVHPADQSVFISFTDHTGDNWNSPDMRIFPDSKGDNTRQYGAIYRLVEDDPASLEFGWGKFISAGEAVDGGGGFACADNLAFDPEYNMWMVTDISTSVQNFPVNREGKTEPGQKNFMGVFGNNSMFMIPTKGAHAGVPQCFAVGPCGAELTGPTFTEDGRTLILSVQHPGELNGTGMGQSEEHSFTIVDREGKEFTQKRVIPIGSNFPDGKPEAPPKPAVVCITRA